MIIKILYIYIYILPLAISFFKYFKYFKASIVSSLSYPGKTVSGFFLKEYINS